MSTPNVLSDGTMLPVGATLQMGKYRIDRYISSGGFGNTYLATNIAFDETVAIKEFFLRDVALRDSETTAVSVVNPTSLPVFQEQKEKFRKEARRLRNLHSDHIVAVSDLFDENDTSYYVMEYIDGESLRDMVKKYRALPEENVKDYLLQTLDALEVVHAQNMYHLDLKPANLMVDKKGCLKVIDFGASKQQKDSGNYSKSAVCYSPGYAPQEQQEQALDKFGPWTDIYALGATCYNVLTGETPPTTTDITDEGESAFHFPASVSERMRKLVIWMMKSRRVDRPQSIQDIRDFLENNSGASSDPQSKASIEGQKEKVQALEETVIARTPNIHTNPRKNIKPEIKVTLQRETTQKETQRVVVEEKPQSTSKLKYIILGCCALAVIIIGGIFLAGSGENSEPYSSSAEQNPKSVKSVVVLFKSADKIDYYALSDDGSGKQTVANSVQNYTPADKQVDVAVSSSKKNNQLNKVDALIESVSSTYPSAKLVFLAQKNLSADPAIKSVDSKLRGFNMSIVFYNPSDYSVNDVSMVEEFVNQNIFP
jgi:serine/threonine protein kinase